MAAGEDQTQAIVFDLLVILFVIQGSFVDARFPFCGGVQRKFLLCFASNRARRRILSTALKRAVEISQGRGLSGIPV
jgi:hypothetical protein